VYDVFVNSIRLAHLPSIQVTVRKSDGGRQARRKRNHNSGDMRRKVGLVLIALVLLFNWWIWLVGYLFLLLVRFMRMGS
jgi:hypothetical protein